MNVINHSSNGRSCSLVINRNYRYFSIMLQLLQLSLLKKIFNPYLWICLLIWERERNVDVREKHHVPPTHAPTRDGTCNIFWCKRWVSNQVSNPARAQLSLNITYLHHFSKIMLVIGCTTRSLLCYAVKQKTIHYFIINVSFMFW